MVAGVGAGWPGPVPDPPLTQGDPLDCLGWCWGAEGARGNWGWEWAAKAEFTAPGPTRLPEWGRMGGCPCGGHALEADATDPPEPIARWDTCGWLVPVKPPTRGVPPLPCELKEPLALALAWVDAVEPKIWNWGWDPFPIAPPPEVGRGMPMGLPAAGWLAA